jgi:integrase
VLFTGLHLSKARALRWDAVDMNKRVAHVCRTVALGVVEERTKTRPDRFVRLNERAIHALEFAKIHAERRKLSTGKVAIPP